MKQGLTGVLKEILKDEFDKTIIETSEKKDKEFAVNMLNGNEPLSKITKYTKLSKEEVLELAKKNGITVVQ